MTEYRAIPLADVISEIRRIASENPDHVYQAVTTGIDFDDEPVATCEYVERDADGNLIGSCIVGRALINLGVEPSTLEFDGGLLTPSALALLGPEQIGTDKSLYWIDCVQARQDAKATWGEAVGEADTRYPDVPQEA